MDFLVGFAGARGDSAQHVSPAERDHPADDLPASAAADEGGAPAAEGVQSARDARLAGATHPPGMFVRRFGFGAHQSILFMFTLLHEPECQCLEYKCLHLCE